MSADIIDSSSFGGVMKQSELVQYKAGTSVSRVLIKKPCGNVAAVAFDQGQGLKEHSEPFDSVVLMIEGEAEISTSIISHHLRAGQMIVLPADQPHSIKAVTKFKMILVMIKA